jgi:hypothetical protein
MRWRLGNPKCIASRRCIVCAQHTRCVRHFLSFLVFLSDLLLQHNTVNKRGLLAFLRCLAACLLGGWLRSLFYEAEGEGKMDGTYAWEESDSPRRQASALAYPRLWSRCQIGR